jgi:hypothetical protein
MIYHTMTKKTDLLRDPGFIQAVSAIQKRAEKQTALSHVTEVFVKTDLFYRASAPNSQLILGRRGTGKTHLLRAFQHDAVSHGLVVKYIDCTALGRAHTGVTAEPDVAAATYFSTFLNQLGTELLDEVIRMEMASDQQKDSIVNKLYHGLPTDAKTAQGEAIFNYRQLSDTLSAVLRDLRIDRFSLVLDEWAQLPVDAQPFFAEHLKRAVMSVPQITVKILAVNYQCNLLVREGSNLVGLERGADLPDIIDMDRYLVWDEKRDFVMDYFAQLIYNHLGVELRWDLTIPPADKRKWMEQFFTQQAAFQELVRAAEGNSRDFLCIFSKAFFDEYSQGTDSQTISVRNITNAASGWYEEGKWDNIRTEPVAVNTLTHIVKEVLKGYKSRSFLVEATKAEHPNLIRLLNERILHRLNNPPSHKENPGVKYELFTVDYGAYVKLRSTNDRVEERVFFEAREIDALTQQEKDLLVPFDDRRSIRRITFDPDTMKATPQSLFEDGP